MTRVWLTITVVVVVIFMCVAVQVRAIEAASQREAEQRAADEAQLAGLVEDIRLLKIQVWQANGAHQAAICAEIGGCPQPTRWVAEQWTPADAEHQVHGGSVVANPCTPRP